MLPLTITDNYILITSDEEIKEGEWCYIPFEHSIKRFGKYFADDWKKVIAHLPITDSADLRGVPLLPPLSSGEDDVEKLADRFADGFPISPKAEGGEAYRLGLKDGYWNGYTAKKKYRFTEEDMRNAIEMARDIDYNGTNDYCYTEDEIIQSLSQPKIPIGFKCEMGTKYYEDSRWEKHPIIVVNQDGQNVILGEWIY